MEIKKEIFEQLRSKVKPIVYKRYISNIKKIEITPQNEIFLFVPNIYLLKWIQRFLMAQIETTIKDITKKEYQIKLELLSQKKPEKVKEKKISQKVSNIDETPLNPHFTFENFIVGSSNQFAFTTAKSVAKSPGLQYNPLFIYGGVGLGKTHLLQAIGNYRANLGDRVIYTTLEQFMNKFIHHLKNNQMESFRKYFRECDILLIDDIQFLSQKEQTQEEFFHTFNKLHSENKQIVLTSDRPPKSIPKLVDRLRSRFEWGLMADIKPPELETKISIIRKKCELDGIFLKKDVIYYLATTMGDNIREIEGALIKIGAMSAMLNKEVTVEFAKNTIKEQLKEKKEKITIDTILYVVAKELNIKPSDIKSKKRSKVIVEARRIAIYLSRKLTSSTMPQIALFFGMKDHTTISHAMKKINSLINENENFRAKIKELEHKILTFKEQEK
jgi:chromosomal replication initiator protein